MTTLTLNARMIESPTKSSVAARFAAVREARGYPNIHTACKAARMTYTTLERVEKAEFYPSLETLVKASRTYDVPVEFLIEGVTGRVDPELLAKLDLKRG